MIWMPWGGAAVLVLGSILFAQPVYAADAALAQRIEEAILKARGSLVNPNASVTDSEASIIAYALHKGGLPVDHPQIAGAADAIVKKVEQGTYGTGNGPAQHIYEAASDAILLVDLDGVKYAGQLGAIRDYISRTQRFNGSWHYPVSPAGEDFGDTSITQFAVLGLWAIQRANVEVAPEVWDKAARWLIATQHTDGAFAYHPQERGDPRFFQPRLSMTAAGASSLLIIQRMLYGDQIVDTPEVVPASRKRFGVLEAFPAEQSPAAPKPAATNKNVSSETLERQAKKAASWLASHFEPRPTFDFYTYELYGCERVGSLLSSDSFGSHNWYQEGAASLLAHQLPTGTWPGSSSPRAMTAFGILFLSRATQSIIKPRVKVRLTGSGLLAGGRGLPDDLSKVAIEDGTVKQRRKLGPIDEMLADLEKSAVDEAPVNPQSVIATLQFDKPDELVGKLEQLPGLLKNPKPEVRQVAAWALGRSGEIRMAPRLIEALSDPDINVAADASLALCVLSRQPQGVIKAELSNERVAPEPPEVVELDVDGEKIPAEQVAAAKTAVAQWRRTSIQGWTRWYLLNRPYDERDDRTQIRNK